MHHMRFTRTTSDGKSEEVEYHDEHPLAQLFYLADISGRALYDGVTVHRADGSGSITYMRIRDEDEIEDDEARD